MENQTDSQKKGFSVALGLVDYINPATYSVNTILIASGLKAIMNAPQWAAFLCGVILSLCFGMVIPTCKLLVGLGKFEFKLPVWFVLAVNTGIFITGSTLLTLVAKPGLVVCVVIVLLAIVIAAGVASKKLNTSVLLLGLTGYSMTYICMAIYAVRAGAWASFVLFVIPFVLMYAIIAFAMKADLMNAKNHWIIESGNITGQIVFAIGLLLLFR